MILNNLNIIGNGGEKKSILINKTKIQKIYNKKVIKNSNERIIDFENAIAFPGLINSHDHLEFNLFPPLANRVYKNYIDWGDDIHKINEDQIESILKIPSHLRFKWGIYKNLLSGITTVIQHGKMLGDSKHGLIDVFTGGKVFHSVKLEKHWKLRINLPDFKSVVVHVGEGCDKSSKEEIKTLINWNLLKKRIIGIHAIALSKEEAKKLKAIVWCPASNYFLYNKTANINELKEETEILFGTDSTASAAGNIWDHLRFARNLKLLEDKKLFDSLTVTPAEIWKLKSLGAIKENYTADLVAVNQKHIEIWDSFYSIKPEDILLILKRGEVIFWDEILKSQLNFRRKEMKYYSKIIFCNKIKYVLGNIGELVNSIHKYNSEIQFPFEITLME